MKLHAKFQNIYAKEIVYVDVGRMSVHRRVVIAGRGVFDGVQVNYWYV